MLQCISVWECDGDVNVNVAKSIISVLNNCDALSNGVHFAVCTFFI